MEIVQKYTLGFHEVLRMFNTLPPSIEPTATGHIIEQIEMIKTIIANGYAYEVDGTIYFDVEKYSKKYNYTILTNRNLEDMLANTRELGGQDDKRGRLDFALWIKAKPETLMQWVSPVSYTHLDVYKRQGINIAIFVVFSLLSVILFFAGYQGLVEGFVTDYLAFPSNPNLWLRCV